MTDAIENSPKASLAPRVDLPDIVFARLQRVGPLCPSQLSVDLGIRVPDVLDALRELSAQGIAEPQPDEERRAKSQVFRTESDCYPLHENPWRIRYRRRKARSNES